MCSIMCSICIVLSISKSIPTNKNIISSGINICLQSHRTILCLRSYRCHLTSQRLILCVRIKLDAIYKVLLSCRGDSLPGRHLCMIFFCKRTLVIKIRLRDQEMIVDIGNTCVIRIIPSAIHDEPSVIEFHLIPLMATTGYRHSFKAFQSS